MLGNTIDIEFSPVEESLHYKVTPYSFHPKIARKYSGTYHLDLGQGLLQCIQDIYKQHHPHEEINGIIVNKK